MITLFSCRKVTKLISDQQERVLSFREKFALRFHLLICTPCRRFRTQIRILSYFFSNKSPEEIIPSNTSLSNDAKKRLQNSIQEQLKSENQEENNL